MSQAVLVPRPLVGEVPDDAGAYLAQVSGSDAWPALVSQGDEVARLVGLAEPRALHRYAPGKWSVKEVVGHLTDTERVYAYRALRFARDDATPLPGFDENHYVPEGRFDARSVQDLVEEWRAVRGATLALYAGLPADSLSRRGVANGSFVSVRALAWLAAGHTAHHLQVLRQRYRVP